jgi:putative flippase GtrA
MSQFKLNNFLRFLIVGVMATALHYFIMGTLLYTTSIDNIIASGTGFALSAVFNYLANAHFTFRSAQTHRHALPRFCITLSAACLINMGVLYGLTQLGVPLIPAQLIATAVVMIWNFTVSALWTFRPTNA